MYLPAHFRIDDRNALFALIRARPLGLLITQGARGLNANHLPFLLDEPRGVLRMHLARANPQWRDFDDNPEVLIVFTDADAYVAPSWRPTKKATGQVVPTWNYASVHVYGRARAIDDVDFVRAQADALTQTQERRRENPWSIDDAPKNYIEAQLRAIVGVEIAIERLEGKCKASQNIPPADRAGVAAGLRAEGGDAQNRVADLVEGGVL